MNDFIRHEQSNWHGRRAESTAESCAHIFWSWEVIRPTSFAGSYNIIRNSSSGPAKIPARKQA